MPEILVDPPGPRSRAYAAELSCLEGPASSTLANGDLPIFWEAAAGANVMDADGNVYIDTTSAFGVAAVGHRNPAVVAAAAEQMHRLVHGMGDFLPQTARLKLARELQRVLPAGLTRVLTGLSGADAVELALKCAAVYTDHPGVISFQGGFHGQSYGTLPLAARQLFSHRFARQLGAHVRRAPFPNPYRRPDGLSEEEDVARCITAVRVLAAEMASADMEPGCVVVEPCQGREGDVFPPATFLQGLRRLCDELGLVLIADEVFTGFGRTGRMWACEHYGVVPDLLCAGKALGGGFPGSLVAGRAEIMDAWRPESAEAPYSSTFLGHPVGCAAALAVLSELREKRLVERSRDLGETMLSRLRTVTAGNPVVGEVRGKGLMLGIELVRDRRSREPYPEIVSRVLQHGLELGLILLPSGTYGNVISLAPPFTITEAQLDYVLTALPKCLGA